MVKTHSLLYEDEMGIEHASYPRVVLKASSKSIGGLEV